MKYLSSPRTRMLALIFGCLLFFKTSHAQFVTLTDSAFISYLEMYYGDCVSVTTPYLAQLDTNCADIQNAVTVNVNSMGIMDLTGIEYFKNLDTLICYGNGLGYIDGFPASLRYIDCSQNAFNQLPPLPGNLTALICGSTNLAVIPSLPVSLTYLDCSGPDVYLDSLPPLPAALQVLNCGYIGNTTFRLPQAWPPALSVLDCSVDNANTLPAFPATLTSLTCHENHLTVLPALQNTALISLDCYGNLLTTLPPLPPTLSYLRCDFNGLTSLPALPDSLTNLFCNNNNLTALPALPNTLVYLYCFSNQIASMPVLPDSLQYFWCYHNQLTYLPALPQELIWIDCGNNMITSIGDVSQTVTEFAADSNNLSSIRSLPLNNLLALNVSNNPDLFCLPPIQSCRLFGTDGIDVAGTGITCLPNFIQPAPFYSTPLVDSLPVCSLTNPNNCAIAWNISGSIYNDANGNCMQDSGEQSLPNVKVNLYQSGNLVQSDYFLGYYSFKTGPGTYQVAVDTTNLPFIPTCSADTTITLTVADSLAYGVNFGLQCKPGFDVGVQGIASWGFTPAASSEIFISAGDFSNFYNANCAAGVSGTVTASLSGPVKYIAQAGGALTPSSVNGNTITWNIADYGTVNFSGAFNILVSTDTTAVSGQQVCVAVSVTPTVGDYNPANNSLSECFTVTNSFDPNAKQATPPGTVDSGGWITYTVHFQNTGTAPAENIIVQDTLDPGLDVSTFQLLASSAKTLTQIMGNVVIFTFPNINLPDSTISFLASQAYVQYRIRTISNLQPDAVISNTASIYFDFNAPVVTNTVSDTVTRGTACMPTYADTTANICAGDTFYIVNKAYTATGTYTDTLMNTAGCDSTVTLNLNVNATSAIIALDEAYLSGLAGPSVPCDTLSNNNYSCYTFNIASVAFNGNIDSFSWTIANAYAYQRAFDTAFYNIDSLSLGIYIDTPPASAYQLILNYPDEYTICLTGFNQCGSFSICDTFGIWFEGINTISADNAVSLYPNPANNLIYIKTEGLHPQTITIYDVDGREVATQRFEPEMDIHNLTPGVYLMEINSLEGVARKRWVKM